MARLRKIFLESTALFQLGPRLDNAELVQLRSIRDVVPFEFLIAEVSWMEYLRHRKQTVKECIKSASGIANQLSTHDMTLPEVNQAQQALSAYLERIENHFKEKAHARGFTIIPLSTNIEVRRLLDMAIDCIPPFEHAKANSEKGFRDSLIMFTILENIKATPGCEVLVVTGDNLLAEGIKLHSTDRKTTICVEKDLPAAVAYMETTLDKDKTLAIRESSEEAKKTMERFKLQLEAKVRGIRELSDRDLQPDSVIGFKMPYPAFLQSGWDVPKIEGIDHLSFAGIDVAAWKSKQDRNATILFKIRCTAHVLVQAPLFGPSISETKYIIGNPVSTLNFTGVYVGDGPTQERQITFRLYGEAQLSLGPGQEWGLDSLTLDRSLSSEEDYVGLAMAERASKS